VGQQGFGGTVAFTSEYLLSHETLRDLNDWWLVASTSRKRKKEGKKEDPERPTILFVGALSLGAYCGSFAPCHSVDCAKEVVTMCAPDSHARNSKQLRMYNLNILRATQCVISFE